MNIPKGFLFASAAASIKKPGRKDMALIFSESESVMAGVFTTNKVKAAPVKLDMRRIKAAKGRAIIANSGNANACTGIQGMRDADEMTQLVAKGLGISKSSVYVCSTGVIGTEMPMERIRPAVSSLIADLSPSSAQVAAEAIMTTDKIPKIVSKNLKINGKTGCIMGIAKGAGMINPNMATMLCFLLTDVSIKEDALDRALRHSVAGSFNRLTVDGDMSTNDTALIMANGVLGNVPVTAVSKDYAGFQKALDGVCLELAKLMAEDGEGATKFIEVAVKGAKSETDAEIAAFSVANSNLVKTAIYGNDANWGRIMAALGYSGAEMKEEKVDISFGKVRIASNGLGTGKDKDAAEVLKEKRIRILIDLHVGKASAEVFTCDLTEEYIAVNATYRT